MKLNNFTFRVLMFVLLCTSLNACKKELPLPVAAQSNSSDVTVQEAQAWLKEKKPGANLGDNWNTTRMVNSGFGTKILKVRINELLLDNKTWVLSDLLFQKNDKGEIEYNVYKVLVDTSYFSNKTGANNINADKRDFISNNDFTGRILCFDINNQLIKGRDYVNGVVKVAFAMKNKIAKGNVIMGTPDYLSVECDDFTQICKGLTSGGGGSEGPDKPVIGGIPLNEVNIVSLPPQIWVFVPTSTPNQGPPPTSFPIGNSSGGSGGESNGESSQISSSDIANSAVVDDGKPKISDIKKYTKCFNDGKEAKSFTMTIYVDQPVAGQGNWSRLTIPQIGVSSNNSYGVPTGINFTTPGGKTFDVGHTFVCFEKNNIDGSSVRQTLGFYPAGGTPYSSGAIKDDSGHDFDVSYKLTVNQDNFNSALTKVENDFKNKRYNLTPIPGVDEYNCSDAAISWMNAGGAGLSTSGTFPFTSTPGEFGQALRNKNGATLNTGSATIGKGPCD